MGRASRIVKRSAKAAVPVRRGRSEPISRLTQIPGRTPVEECECPVCVHDMAIGRRRYKVEEDGTMVELPPRELPEMMIVYVRGTKSTSPELPKKRREYRVPVGTMLMDLLGYIGYLDQKLNIAFPPGTLSGEVDGAIRDPYGVLEPGEEVRVYAERDPEASKLLAALLKPLPGPS